MKSSRRHLLSLLSLLPILSLSACGFHLRGSTPDSRLSFASVHVDAPAGTPLERELRSAIRAGGTPLVSDPKTAAITLRVLSQAQEKKILTLNAQGQVREFSLTYRMLFEVADPGGRKLLPAQEIALQALLSYSESQALAKEAEEKMTFDDLRRDAVSQIMRQLARLKQD